MTSEKIMYIFGSVGERGVRHSIFARDKKIYYRVRASDGTIVSETAVSPEEANRIKKVLGTRDEDKSPVRDEKRDRLAAARS